jgi:hypothetical protein
VGFLAPPKNLKVDVPLNAVSRFYRTVCTMDMSVIMYCYCSLLPSPTALLTTSDLDLARTFLLTLDTEEKPVSPSSSRCRTLVYPG